MTEFLDNLLRYAKAHVALVGTLATWIVATFPSTPAAKYAAIAVALLTALGVWKVPNRKARNLVLGDHPTRKCGRRRPSGYGWHLPRLGDYLTPEAFTLPPHPAVDFLKSFTGWQMLGNDSFGDCVAVAIANAVALVTGVLGTLFYPGLSAVVAFYKTQNPNFDINGGSKTGPGSKYDGGMDESKAVADMVTIGMGGKTAVAGGTVDHTNLDEIKACINVLGFVVLGILVTDANQREFENDQPWDYVANSPDEGAHGILGGGHLDEAASDLTFITWADETSLTDVFYEHQVEEAHFLVFEEHLDTKEFTAGMDAAALAADVKAMFGVTLPLPPAPTPTPTPAASTVVVDDAALVAKIDELAARDGESPHDYLQARLLSLWKV